MLYSLRNREQKKNNVCNFFIIQKYDFLLIILFIIVAMLNFDR